MAAEIRITFPTDGAAVPLIGGQGGGMFFAAGGIVLPEGRKPHFGLLFLKGSNDEIAHGNVFREPTDDKKTWGIWFNLNELRDIGPDDRFRLEICRLRDNAPNRKVLDHVDDIRFVGLRPEGKRETRRDVSVLFPSGGDFCNEGLPPYGGYASPDTRIIEVQVLKGTTVVVKDTAPYFNEFGFWTASMPALPAETDTYVVKAIGDHSDHTGSSFRAGSEFC